MKKELNKLSQMLSEKDVALIEKDNFKFEVSKESSENKSKISNWYNVLIKYGEEFYSFYEGLSDLESILEILETTSEESNDFKVFQKKYSIANIIKAGKYKMCSNHGLNPNDNYIRIYNGENSGYDFKGLFNYLQNNLNKDEIVDYYSEKQITASITSIKNSLNGEFYSKELELINSQLNKKICGYCECTVVNANNISYIDNCGCVSKELICPDCLELHSLKMLSLLNNLPKNSTNKDKVDAISYIYSQLDN